MADESTSTAPETEPDFDMASAVETIGASVFPAPIADPDEVEETVEEPVATAAAAAPALSTAAPATDAGLVPTVLDVPKSWKAEMHPYWSKLDPAVQKYYIEREKQMLDGLDQYKAEAQQAKTWRESLSPYQQTLRQLGMDELTAAKSLFQADHILRYAPTEQKVAYFKRLADNYSIDLKGLAPASAAPAPLDPAIQALQDKLATVEHTLTARQQADHQSAQDKLRKDVDAFASDPAHPHFNAVADDMMPFIQAGLSLQDAYDKAVWAHPVTREQQLQARLQTEAEKQRENARLQALPKKKAASASMRSVDTTRTPTEPVGSIEETMKDTLRTVRSRVAH